MARPAPQQLSFEGLCGPVSPPPPAVQAGEVVGQRLRRSLSDSLTATTRSSGVARPRLAERIGEAALFAEEWRTMPAADTGQDAVERLTELLDRRAGAEQERLVAPIAALVARAATLQEIADGLAALFPQLDTERLGEAMAQALVLASLVGRDDIASQAGG